MKTTALECSFCGNNKTKDLFGLKNFTYCDNCKLGWIKTYTPPTYGETYYVGKSSNAAKLFAPIARLFYSVRNSYAKGKVGLWIDVGAGDGGYLETVPSKRKMGVEVSSAGRNIMKMKGIEAISDKAFLKKKKLNADVISFWHMLEHVQNPMDYLVAARQNLKKGGKLIIGIPNVDSLEAQFTQKYWFHLQPEFHIWHFSPKSLNTMLEKTGFHIKRIDHWSIEHHLTGVLQSFINKFSGSRENVLHKLVKRGTGKNNLKEKDIFWCAFWMTIGLPMIVGFWILGSLAKKPGTFITLASRKTP